MNRRGFIALIVGARVAAGCKALASANSPASHAERVVDAGPVNRYAANRVDGGFREQGFFLVRKDGKLVALSSFCTHRHCKLTAESDSSFYCSCHGSTFDPNGKVTEGPAKRDLPMFATLTNQKGELLVKVTT
jgi:Rieske Fe-S protein